MDYAEHWNNVFRTRSSTEVSWFEANPTTSLGLIRKVSKNSDSVIDIGAGRSNLARHLLQDGYTDVTLLDISSEALEATGLTFMDAEPRPKFIAADITTWLPGRTYDVWHDRAVFHFMITNEMRNRYVSAASEAIRPGGIALLGTFASEGPEQCSGINVMRYSTESLVDCFQPTFDLIDSHTQMHRTPTGNVQPFIWATFRHR